MCAIVIYIRVHTAAAVRVLVVLYDIRVLVVRTPVSSLSFQVQQYLEHGTCKHPTDYKSEVWRSVSRVKTPCEQGLPHYTCYKQSNAFLMRRKGRRSAVSPWNVDLLLRSTTLRRICTQRFRAEEFPLLCPKPKVMPRFSRGDVGEARWLLSHRWTDTSPILPDAAHDSRNQGAWCRSLR